MIDKDIPNLEIGFILDGQAMRTGYPIQNAIFITKLLGEIPFFTKFDISVGKHIFYNGVWEANFTNKFIAIVNGFKEENFTFIDVGMHFGYYSAIFSHLRPNNKIIGFEPDPTNIRLSTINLFDHKDKEIHYCALGEENKIVTLYRGTKETARTTVELKEVKPEEDMIESECHMKTIETFNINYSSPMLIKIDAQGKEKFLLEAFYPLIQSGSFIFVEGSREDYMDSEKYSYIEYIEPNWILQKI